MQKKLVQNYSTNISYTDENMLGKVTLKPNIEFIQNHISKYIQNWVNNKLAFFL